MGMRNSLLARRVDRGLLETGTQTITFIFLDYEERLESLWGKNQKKTVEAVQWSRVVTALAALILNVVSPGSQHHYQHRAFQ